MKIAFVSLMKVLPWGGSEDLWFKTAKVALSKGHTVYSITQHWDIVPNKITELKRLGATTVFYYDQSNSLLNRAARKLNLWIAPPVVVPQVDADVYIISNGSTWDFIYSRAITDKFIDSNKPYVLISQHSYENGNIIADKARPYALDIIRRAAGVFFVSQRNLESAQRQVAGFIDKGQIISNPLNTIGREIKPYPKSSNLLMACVARLDCGFKGQDILLQALSSPQWAIRDFRLKFYGTGHHYDYLEALIELYGLQGKVSLEGQVSDVDLIWETNQVLVLPSFSEGTPLSLLEAMMAGRAALATDVGDNGRYVLTDKTGILIDTASVKCLASGLEHLWIVKDSLDLMGQEAFHHAQAITNFQPEKTLLSFIEALP